MNCAQQDSLVRVYPTQPVHYFSRQDQAAQALMDWDALIGVGDCCMSQCTCKPGTAYTCTNDGVFPDVWLNIAGFIFESAKDCCDHNFGDDCIVIDDCPEVPTTVLPTTTEAQTTTTEAP